MEITERVNEDGIFDELIANSVGTVYFEMIDNDLLHVGLFSGDQSHQVCIAAVGGELVVYHEPYNKPHEHDAEVTE